MKLSLIALGFLSAALCCGRASAQETDYAAASLALPQQQAQGTARSEAMGSAMVAVPDGSASLLWNPAGLSRETCTELGLHTEEGLGNIFQEMAIFGTPLGSTKSDGTGGTAGGLAVSVGYVNYGTFQGRDATGLPTGNYSATGISGSVGWGIEILPGLSAGADVKANQSDFAGENYNTYAGDLGMLYAVPMLRGLDLGLSYNNISLGNNIPSGELAQGWRLGAGYTLGQHLLLAVSGELQSHSVNTMQLGAEYLVGNVDEKSNVLAIRVGYDLNYPDPELSGLTGLTFGLGYTLTRAFALDYAFVTNGDLGNQQFLSLTFKFGCVTPERRRPMAMAQAEPMAVAEAAPASTPAAATAPVVAAVPPPPVVVQAILLGDSHFDFDKSTLKDSGMSVLDQNIKLLKDNPKTMVRVAGYTSMQGTAEYNQLLSERRAAAVQDYMVAKGIDPSRITTVGYGATEPASYEETPSDINSPAAKSNMRVLFEVTVK